MCSERCVQVVSSARARTKKCVQVSAQRASSERCVQAVSSARVKSPDSSLRRAAWQPRRPSCPPTGPSAALVCVCVCTPALTPHQCIHLHHKQCINRTKHQYRSLACPPRQWCPPAAWRPRYPRRWRSAPSPPPSAQSAEQNSGDALGVSRATQWGCNWGQQGRTGLDNLRPAPDQPG